MSGSSEVGRWAELDGKAHEDARRPHLLIFVTADWYFWSHRRSIASAALTAGWRVSVACHVDDMAHEVGSLGIEVLPLRIRRTGTNPFSELRSLWEVVSLYRREKPDLVHHVAVKPIIYGSIAARLARIRFVVNAVSGLGYLFTAKDLKARVLRFFAEKVYRVVLLGTTTIFQNPDDRDYFIKRRILRRDATALIRGSGVDLLRFRFSPTPSDEHVVMYAGRMLYSKGIADLVNAVPILRAMGLGLRVVLVGDTDSENPEGIPRTRLEQWDESGLVEWWGPRSDMPEVLSLASIVVLTSQREGVPKVLLEAAAIGRPLVASDVPGCREVVDHGKNGLLVPYGSPQAIAEAIRSILNVDGVAARMGRASRSKVEAEFSEEQVVEDTLALYERIRRGSPRT